MKTSGGLIALREIYRTLDAARCRTSTGSLDTEILALGKSFEPKFFIGKYDSKMPMNKGVNLSCTAQKINTAKLY